jgi:hypothetical protein
MRFSVIYSFDIPAGRADPEELEEQAGMIELPEDNSEVQRALPPGLGLFPDDPDDEPTWRDEDGDPVWYKTEGNEQYELAHLEGEWETGRHRKFCAMLTLPQFIQFVEHCGLTAEDVQTMGSLGAPGFGVGWAPAISFHLYTSGYADDYYANAYVTPLCCKPDGSPIRAEGCDERDWERVRTAIIRRFQ